MTEKARKQSLCATPDERRIRCLKIAEHVYWSGSASVEELSATLAELPLGFAIAIPKEVVLICSDERGSRFPFDVQHRNIIKYKRDAPQDFGELRGKITARIQAIQKKQSEIGRVSTLSPLKDTEGLSQHEQVALVTVMQNTFISPGAVSGWQIQRDMNGAGFTDIAVSLALKSLEKKDMIISDVDQDQDGDRFSVYSITRHGEEWLVQNQEKLVLKREPAPPPASDGIPF